MARLVAVLRPVQLGVKVILFMMLREDDSITIGESALFDFVSFPIDDSVTIDETFLADFDAAMPGEVVTISETVLAEMGWITDLTDSVTISEVFAITSPPLGAINSSSINSRIVG